MPSNASLALEPIVPFHMFADTVDEQIADMIDLSQRTGIRRFVLTFPDNGVRIDGRTRPERFEAFADMLAAVKSSLAKHNIDVGWWCAPSLNAGPNPHTPDHADYPQYDVQHIVNFDGTVSPVGCCPLDERFQQYLSGHIALVAQRAQPFVIFFEDDYQVSNHPQIKYGCFCPLHLDTFAKRMGRHYSRTELWDIFTADDAQSAEFRRQWALNSRDSLVEMASVIRSAVDRVSPATRLALCQSGSCDNDGDITEPVVRALAGTTRPMVRLFGSSYSSDDAWSLPAAIFHFLHSRQTLASDIECLHESDTYPHTRFYMSAAKLTALLTTATLYGTDGSLLYITQYLDDPNEDRGYADLVTAMTPKLNALKDAAAECHVIGVGAAYRPLSHVFTPLLKRPQDTQFIRPSSSRAWPGVLGLMGIPYTAHNGSPTVISGETICDYSDDELEAIFSGGVMLDGKAAWHLTQMGKSDLAGVEARDGSAIRCLYERIAPDTPFANAPAGTLMYNMAIAPAGSEGGGFYDLQGGDGTQIITEFLGPRKNTIAPAWTLYENALGGRVAVTAFDLAGNRSSSLFNYRRKWLLRHTLEWLGKAPLPVYIENAPNIFCIAAEHQNGQYALISIMNLSTDECPCIDLAVKDEWAGRDVLLLDDDGVWKPIAAKRIGIAAAGSTMLHIDHPCRTMRPVILKLA